MSAASLLLRRPVKWIEDRREHFMASIQERDQYWDIEVGVDADGRLLGVRGRMISRRRRLHLAGHQHALQRLDQLSRPLCAAALQARTSRWSRPTRCGTAPVRGAGYPEGAFAMERVLDAIADELGLDRVEVRRRNLVPAEEMPYKTPMAARSAQPDRLRQRRFSRLSRPCLQAGRLCRLSARAGQRRGPKAAISASASATGIKGTGRGPFESAIVRVGRSGKVSVYTGAMAMGQGLQTALAQISAEEIGVSPDDITVICGDTATIRSASAALPAGRR